MVAIKWAENLVCDACGFVFLILKLKSVPVMAIATQKSAAKTKLQLALDFL